MEENTGSPTVKYCFRCGRRVGRTGDHCWYCDAPIRRIVRPPRRCAFCQQIVAREAVKCHHCGEFLDGRPRPAESTAQIVFVIDRSLLPGERRDVQLLPGRPIPPDVARALNAETVRAIEQNQPALISQRGVRALPAPTPDDDDIIDVAPSLPARRTREIAANREGEVEAGLPATRATNLAPVDAAREEHGLTAWFGRKFKGYQEPAGMEEEPAADARDKYRTCENCGTEIFTADNYCYHCGVQYHKPVGLHNEDVPRRLGERSNAAYYCVSMVMIAALAALRLNLLPFVTIPQLPLALASAAALCCVIAFFNRRHFFSQAFAIILLLATGFAYFL